MHILVKTHGIPWHECILEFSFPSPLFFRSWTFSFFKQNYMLYCWKYYSLLLLMSTGVAPRFWWSQTALQRLARIYQLGHMCGYFSRKDPRIGISGKKTMHILIWKYLPDCLQKCSANSCSCQNYTRLCPHTAANTGTTSHLHFPHQMGRHWISLLFNLHFSDYLWCWGSFHMFNGLLDSYCELSVHILCPFFFLGVSFLLMCWFFQQLNCSVVMSILLFSSSVEIFLVI